MESVLPPGGPSQHPQSYTNRSPRSLHDSAHEQRSPSVYGHALVDPRMASPRVSVQSLSMAPNGHTHSPRLPKQEHPTSLHSLNPIARSPKAADPSSAGNAVPGISSLVNGAALAPLGSAGPQGGPTASPNGAHAQSSSAEGPRDIPNEKIGFGGEDVRALRQLDRAFIA
jgi:hypothetical protein